MPLTMMKAGETSSIKKVGGGSQTRQHLENLGFVVGASVTLVAEMAGNVIVHIKQSRIAISRELAGKILI